ncbi:hypothetical protein M5689_002077 [Euphorbia peplus]|nr:hypothetical protein M5689_002077 [Euphorbia peplus]
MKYNSVLVAVIVFALFINITSGNEVKMAEPSRMCARVLDVGLPCSVFICHSMCLLRYGNYAFGFCLGALELCHCRYPCWI